MFASWVPRLTKGLLKGPWSKKDWNQGIAVTEIPSSGPAGERRLVSEQTLMKRFLGLRVVSREVSASR